jgi:hypothetical protein
MFRCSKRDCRHRVRVVSNSTDNTVCVERTDMDHDRDIHDAKSSLTKNAKDIIAELFDRGLKPKAILTHFLVSTNWDQNNLLSDFLAKETRRSNGSSDNDSNQKFGKSSENQTKRARSGYNGWIQLEYSIVKLD